MITKKNQAPFTPFWGAVDALDGVFLFFLFEVVLGGWDPGVNFELLAAVDFCKVFLISILSLSILACQGPEHREALVQTPVDENGIIAGTAVMSGDAAKDSVVMVLGPDVGPLNRTAADYMTCTGVLVDENVVLTAAHCVAASRIKIPYFLHKQLPDLGMVSFASDTSVHYPITKFIVHENYRGQGWQKISQGFRPQVPADMALVYFEGSRPSSSRVAHLPKGKVEVNKSSSRIDLYGYGYQRFDQEEVSEQRNIILKGREFFAKNQPLLTTSKKVKTFEKEGFIFDQRSSSGICYGDSGGPAFVKENGEAVLVGIHSHRTGIFKDDKGVKAPTEKILNDCQYESFVTRVDAYLPWISENTAHLNKANLDSLTSFAEANSEFKILSPLKSVEIKSLSLRIVEKNILNTPAPKSLTTSLYHLNGSSLAMSTDAVRVVRWLSLEIGWHFSREGWSQQSESFTESSWNNLESILKNNEFKDVSIKFVVTARFNSEDYRREAWLYDSNSREILVVREIVTAK